MRLALAWKRAADTVCWGWLLDYGFNPFVNLIQLLMGMIYFKEFVEDMEYMEQVHIVIMLQDHRNRHDYGSVFINHCHLFCFYRYKYPLILINKIL